MEYGLDAPPLNGSSGLRELVLVRLPGFLDLVTKLLARLGVIGGRVAAAGLVRSAVKDSAMRARPAVQVGRPPTCPAQA